MPSRQNLVIISIIGLLSLCGLLWSSSFTTYSIPNKTATTTMGITHIVLFQFKSDTSADTIKEAGARMIGLKDNCMNPTSGKPYIRSSNGGIDNSIEEKQRGMTHGFVVEFDNVEDRDYYVREDPVHQEFKKWIGDFLKKAQVVDFAGGVF